MGGINPNPPAEASPVILGTQLLYVYAPRNANSTGVDMLASNVNAQAITAAGTQVAFPTYSLLNAVTKLPRAVRQSGAAANANAGFVSDSNSSEGTAMFPKANGQGGFRVRLYAGFDANVGSIATTQLVSGIGRTGGGPTPSAGIAPNNAAVLWMGLYNLGAGGGLLFGYKNPGSATVFPLSTGVDLSSLWGAYKCWFIDIFCSPSGPRTFYNVALLNAAGTAFLPVLAGSTTLFAPGVNSPGPWHVAMPTVAANNTDVFMQAATVQAFPLGSLSF